MSKFGRNIDICMNLPPLDESWHEKCEDKWRKRYMSILGDVFDTFKGPGGRCGQKAILRNVLIVNVLMSVGRKVRGFGPLAPFGSPYYSRPSFFRL